MKTNVAALQSALSSAILLGAILTAITIYVFKPKLLARALIALTIVSLFVGVVFLGNRNCEKNFNNGYCLQCGTKYQAIEHKNYMTYYECPECYFGTWR